MAKIWQQYGKKYGNNMVNIWFYIERTTLKKHHYSLMEDRKTEKNHFTAHCVGFKLYL